MRSSTQASLTIFLIPSSTPSPTLIKFFNSPKLFTQRDPNQGRKVALPAFTASIQQKNMVEKLMDFVNILRRKDKGKILKVKAKKSKQKNQNK